jgi:hypothetical protein
MKQTSQPVHAIKQSIYLDVYLDKLYMLNFIVLNILRLCVVILNVVVFIKLIKVVYWCFGIRSKCEFIYRYGALSGTKACTAIVRQG